MLLVALRSSAPVIFKQVVLCPIRMVDADDLDDVHETILDELQEGRCTPGYLAEVSGESRQVISERLRDLVVDDDVREVHADLYELEADPRHFLYNLHPVVRAWYEARDPIMGVVNDLAHGVAQLREQTTDDEAFLAALWVLVTRFDTEYRERPARSGPDMDWVEKQVDKIAGDRED